MPESLTFSGDRAHRWRCAVSVLLVGYARCSTDQQDVTVQLSCSIDGESVDAFQRHDAVGLGGQ